MRLVCPNCDAEYEVDAAAIPLAGRDVQCSNCGHAWFQTHPDAAADDAEPDIFDVPPPVVEVVPHVVENIVPEPEVDDIAEPEPVMTAAPRSLDETVLAVLREEAEREAAARRAEAAVAAKAPVIETQTEMPLAQDQSSMAAAVRRIARLRGAEPEVVVPPPALKSRREMLPAIEEINSTLRATGDRRSDEDNAIAETMKEPGPAQGSFRRGFLILVLLAVVLVALYVFAPLIAVKVPALAGVATGYVTACDAARVWLNVELRALIDALRGLAGGKGGCVSTCGDW